MKELISRIKRWYSGFVDIKMSPPEDKNFSISIKPVPASRLKRIVDWSWKFWRENWGWLVTIFIALVTLIITIIVNWSAIENFFTRKESNQIRVTNGNEK